MIVTQKARRTCNLQAVAGATGFSASSSSAARLPATRVAVGGFSALFLTSARAVIAALIGVAVLGLLRQARPQRKDLVSLTIVSIGVVVGFPC